MSQKWKFVPVEPTESQMRATGYDHFATFARTAAARDYKAMVDAAPAVPAVTRDELLRSMDAWGASGFVVDDRAVDFLNYFLGSRTALVEQLA